MQGRLRDCSSNAGWVGEYDTCIIHPKSMPSVGSHWFHTIVARLLEALPCSATSRLAQLNLPSVPCSLAAQEAVDIFGNVDELLQIYQEARATRQTDTMAGVEEELHLGEGVMVGGSLGVRKWLWW